MKTSDFFLVASASCFLGAAITSIISTSNQETVCEPPAVVPTTYPLVIVIQPTVAIVK